MTSGLAGCSAPESANVIRLKAAGSTFAYPLYVKWADAYAKAHPNVEIDYQSIGSSGGINLVSSGRVDFGATDGPMTDAQMQAFVELRGTGVLHVPVALGADVVSYNVPGVSAELQFTPRALAGIFLGTITKWNDAELASANAGLQLPDAEIKVIHRADGSGTTFVWTDFLSKVSDEWRTSVGRGTSVKWPVGTGVTGNQGVADAIKATPNAVGYIELTYAIQAQLPVGHVQNSARRFIKPDLQSVTAAAAESAAILPDDFRVSITNTPGEDAYPIASFTWALVPRTIADRTRKEAVTSFLEWALTDGQQLTAGLSYARVPEAVAAKARTAVSQVQ